MVDSTVQQTVGFCTSKTVVAAVQLCRGAAWCGAVVEQDGVRHPDKGTDKTILLISRHYWRPRSDNVI